ncbi:hypothetical protein FNQ90_25860, partial [Streptomyces alkaliphilus]
MGTLTTLLPGPAISPKPATTTLHRRPRWVTGPAGRVADALYGFGGLHQALGVRLGRTDSRVFIDAFTTALAPGADLLLYRPELHPLTQRRGGRVPDVRPPPTPDPSGPL